MGGAALVSRRVEKFDLKRKPEALWRRVFLMDGPQIAFSLLLGLALIFITVSAPSDPATAGVWLTDSSRRATNAIAPNLVPFAGIAFLWFIGVVRGRIRQREDRFFAPFSWAAVCYSSPCCSSRPPSPTG